MLRVSTLIIGFMTLVWLLTHLHSLSWVSLMAGCALASSLFIFTTTWISPKANKPREEDQTIHWQIRLAETQKEMASVVEELSQENQKLKQKTQQAEDRCLSYQKLVDVHQQEIEKLRKDQQVIGEMLTEKERKISQLYESQMEPDLFQQMKEAEPSKEFLDKFQKLQQEKKLLAGELDSLKELISNLRSPMKKVRKKKTTPESESHDLLG